MRKFVILEKNEGGFPKEKIKDYKGYVKIEVRNGNGRILFNVEGLDNIEGTDRVYKGYLIGKKRGKIVNVDAGTIMVNEKGKGSLEWKFNSESVGNTGFPITDFNVVLVKLAWVNGKDLDTLIPLYGYIHEKVEDINTLIKQLKEREDNITEKEDKIHNNNKREINVENVSDEQKTMDDAVQDDMDNEKLEEEKENKTEKAGEPQKEEVEEEEQKVEEQRVEEQIEEEEEEKEVEIEERENEKEKIDIDREEYMNKDDVEIKGEYGHHKREARKKQDLGNKNDYSKLKCDYNDNLNSYGHSVNKSFNYIQSIKDYSRQVAKWTLNTLKYFEEVQPFNSELEGYQWWKIEYDSKGSQRGFLPYYSYIANNYHPYPLFNRITTCQSLMRKYNHYIFGIVKQDEDIKYYVYGIPGKFKRSEQPFRGMTGFNTWIEKGGKNRERVGYWLIHIDAISGKIVNPLKPTTPGR